MLNLRLGEFMNRLLCFCRPGFEKECLAELQDQLAAKNIWGRFIAEESSGWVDFILSPDCDTAVHWDMFDLNQLIFSRQIFYFDEVIDLNGQDDRATPISNALLSLFNNLGLDLLFSDILVQSPDTNEGKKLNRFCKQFVSPLASSLRKLDFKRVYSRSDLPVIQLFFTDYATVRVGIAKPDRCSPFTGGILRLKFPADAPSRSTLKLDEAFQVLLTPSEREKYLIPGMIAVDLGAAPGGWTWQLVKRGMEVYAVDNGPMAESLMATGQVNYLREDAFHWRPSNTVDWLVCDVVEQPMRIAKLITQWFQEGLTRHAMINLKLPMKKRYIEVKNCLDLIATSIGPRVKLKCKQLYHDRMEVTLYIQIL